MRINSSAIVDGSLKTTKGHTCHTINLKGERLEKIDGTKINQYYANKGEVWALIDTEEYSIMCFGITYCPYCGENLEDEGKQIDRFIPNTITLGA